MGNGNGENISSATERAMPHLLLADSEVGKEDILNFYGPYGVTPDRVKVLPFLPASYLAVDVSESERQRVRVTTTCQNAICSIRLNFGLTKTTPNCSCAGFIKSKSTA